jgi:hypothetical protein
MHIIYIYTLYIQTYISSHMLIITSIQKHCPPMRSKKIHHVLLQVLEASASEEASGENNANTVRKPGADRLERCVFLGGWACLKMVKYIYIYRYIYTQSIYTIKPSYRDSV